LVVSFQLCGRPAEAGGGNPTGEPGQALAFLRSIPLSKLQNQQTGVYFAGQDFSAEPPAFFVERPVARQWLDEGKAWSIHHGRDIALSPEAEQQMAEETDPSTPPGAPPPEESCVMGEHVMDANVEKRLWARRMVRSWNWRVAVAENLRALHRAQARLGAETRESATD